MNRHPSGEDLIKKENTEDNIFKMLDEMPEYKIQGREVQRVLGGFGALGNPSSFHHPIVQDLRNDLKKNVFNKIFI